MRDYRRRQLSSSGGRLDEILSTVGIPLFVLARFFLFERLLALTGAAAIALLAAGVARRLHELPAS